jgi:hypothetical protein
MANAKLRRLLEAKSSAVRTFLAARAPARRPVVAMVASGRPEENVVGVGLGRKLVKGRLTARQSVRFYVKRKLGLKALADWMVLPRFVDGIPTDVIETGPLRALPAARAAPAASRTPIERRRMRPARPGCSVGFELTGEMAGYVMAGTFGALVEKDGRRFVLSNNHVLANENALPIGAPIFQPGLLDGGDPATDRIATLTQFVPLQASGTNDVDAAIAEVPPGKKLASRVFLPRIGQLRSGDPLPPEEGMPVAKVGRTTSYTTGTILDVQADVRVGYEIGEILFRDQIVVVTERGSFSQGGDSGSLVVHRRKEQPVGLLFAGSDTHTICNPIRKVLDALGVVVLA